MGDGALHSRIVYCDMGLGWYEGFRWRFTRMPAHRMDSVKELLQEPSILNRRVTSFMEKYLFSYDKLTVFFQEFNGGLVNQQV